MTDDDELNRAFASVLVLVGIIIISSHYFGVVGFATTLIAAGLHSLYENRKKKKR